MREVLFELVARSQRLDAIFKLDHLVSNLGSALSHRVLRVRFANLIGVVVALSKHFVENRVRLLHLDATLGREGLLVFLELSWGVDKLGLLDY